MVKIGYRKPAPRKSFSARTTGKAKRTIKASIDPTYGKKGTGWIKDPNRAAYNKVYNKTTTSGTNDNSSCATGLVLGCGCLPFILIFIIIWNLFWNKKSIPLPDQSLSGCF